MGTQTSLDREVKSREGVPTRWTNYDGSPRPPGQNRIIPKCLGVANNDLVPLTFNLGGVPGTQTLYIAVQ